MALKIRLARLGAKKKPYYRVVVTEKHVQRNGRFLDIVGFYNPNTNPITFDLNMDLLNEWIGKGAKPSNTVASLMAKK